MRMTKLAGLGLTVLVVVGCGPTVERATIGAGGMENSGGQDAAAGSGGQTVAPYIEPAWIKVLPNIKAIDVAADTANQVVVLGYGFDPQTSSLDGFPMPPGATFIAKINTEGQVVWLRAVEGPREGRAIATGPNDQVFVLSTTPPLVVSAPPPWPQWQRFYVTALGANGELLWEQSFGGDYEQKIQLAIGGADIVVDKDGNAILGAAIGGRLDTPLGTIETQLGTFGYDASVVFMRIASDGTFLQLKHLDALKGQLLGGIVMDGADQILAAVRLDEAESIVKLDASFAPVWTKGFSGNGYLRPMRVASGKDGDVLAAGIFSGTMDFGSGPVQAKSSWTPFFVRLDSEGNHKADKTYPQTQLESDFPVTLAANALGEFTVSMQFAPSIDLGGGAISNDGMWYDAAVGRYAADGTYVSATSMGGVGEQQPIATAVSPPGRLYWLVSYMWSLKYGNKVLVEPPPADDPWATAKSGSVLMALPP